jgi:hypothetical protein
VETIIPNMGKGEEVKILELGSNGSAKVSQDVVMITDGRDAIDLTFNQMDALSRWWEQSKTGGK